MRTLSLLFIVGVAAGVAPTVPVKVLYRSASMGGLDDSKRSASSMSLTEYYAGKGLETTARSPRRRGRVPPDTVKEATEIIRQVYLANPHVTYGLWKVCEEALAEKNIKISQRRIEDTLTDVKRSYGNVRGYQRVPPEQEAVLEQLFGMRSTDIREIHQILETQFGRSSIPQSTVAKWVYHKRLKAKRLAREKTGTIQN